MSSGGSSPSPPSPSRSIGASHSVPAAAMDLPAHVLRTASGVGEVCHEQPVRRGARDRRWRCHRPPGGSCSVGPTHLLPRAPGSREGPGAFLCGKRVSKTSFEATDTCALNRRLYSKNLDFSACAIRIRGLLERHPKRMQSCARSSNGCSTRLRIEGVGVRVPPSALSLTSLVAWYERAPGARLDGALVSDTRGSRFESWRVHSCWVELERYST